MNVVPLPHGSLTPRPALRGLSDTARFNIGAALLVTVAIGGTAYAFGARSLNGWAALGAAGAMVPGAYLGGNGAVFAFRTVYGTDSSNWAGALGWAILGALAGAGIAGGGMYAAVAATQR